MSRSTRPSPFGKRTEKAQTKISPETKVALAEKWHCMGYRTEAEYLAELIELAAHGVDAVLSLQKDRLLSIVGMGQKRDTGNK